jgi:hypothetical protein
LNTQGRTLAAELPAPTSAHLGRAPALACMRYLRNMGNAAVVDGLLRASTIRYKDSVRGPNHWKPADSSLAVLIFVGAAFAGFVAVALLNVQGNHPQFDGNIYRKIAEDPGVFHQAPFSFRVLTPWLVRIMPVSTRSGFMLTTVLGVAGTAAILFLYVRNFEGQAAALRAVVYFGLAGGVLLLFVDPWLVDAPTMFLSMLTFLLVSRSQMWWATVTATAAVANHEYVLLVLFPLAIAYLVGKRRGVDARVVPFIALPMLTYVVIRYTPLVYDSIPSYTAAWDTENIVATYDLRLTLDGGLSNAVLFSISASFGAACVLAAVGFRGASRFVRATSLLIPFVVILPVFATDWDRMLTLAFPVVLPLASRVRLRWWILVPFLAIQAALAALSVWRISTLYNDYYTGYATGHYENRNVGLTLVVLFGAVAVAVVGVAVGSRPRRVGATFASQEELTPA